MSEAEIYAGIFSRVAVIASTSQSAEAFFAVGLSSLATRRPVPTTPKGGLQMIESEFDLPSNAQFGEVNFQLTV